MVGAGGRRRWPRAGGVGFRTGPAMCRTPSTLIPVSRASLARWRVLVVEMRQRGAFLPDDENMERLIEWLSRVQSANLFE
jgi:hypothetical protein